MRKIVQLQAGSLFVLFALFLLPGTASAQVDFTLTRFNYEAGVAYTEVNESVAQFTITGCAVDDLSFKVEWGDHYVEPLVAIEQLPFPTPIGGPHPQRAAHKYAAVNSATKFTATVTRNPMHCTNTFDHLPAKIQTYSVAVFPRALMKALDRNTEYPPQSGREIEIRATIDRPAPLSSTRIYLKPVTGGNLIDPAYPLATFVDVPAGQSDVKTTFHIIQNVAAAAPLKIQATAGSIKTLTINVLP